MSEIVMMRCLIWRTTSTQLILTTVNMSSFIQWNVRSINSNREELNILLSDFNPDVVCLQETKLKADSTIDFKHYSTYHRSGNDINGTIHGGTAILVKSTLPHQQITLRTSLQAVAIRATCFKTITVCSIYLPPSLKWTKADIEDLLNQLPSPVLLLGDFNAHSRSWGCNNTDNKGKIIEDLVLQSNLSVLNNGCSTYLHPGTGSTSAIDISICQPNLFMDLNWKVHEDLCGSDHFPLLIQSNQSSPSFTKSSWKLSKADWNTFSQKADSELGQGYVLDSDDPVAHFTTILSSVALATIPKSKNRLAKHDTVWFNEECRAAVRNRRKALKRVKNQPSDSNMENYRIIRAKTRRTIKTTKRKSWQSYVSKINSRTPIKKVWSMIRKISGKHSSSKVHPLHVNDDDVTDVPGIANALGQTFSDNSSSEQFNTKFQSFRRQAERQFLNFSSNNIETYNNIFSLKELTSAISKSHDTAVGPDDIHYQMLKHLPTSAMDTLLNVINNIWLSGNFPSSWRKI